MGRQYRSVIVTKSLSTNYKRIFNRRMKMNMNMMYIVHRTSELTQISTMEQKSIYIQGLGPVRLHVYRRLTQDIVSKRSCNKYAYGFIIRPCIHIISHLFSCTSNSSYRKFLFFSVGISFRTFYL